MPAFQDTLRLANLVRSLKLDRELRRERLARSGRPISEAEAFGISQPSAPSRKKPTMAVGISQLGDQHLNSHWLICEHVSCKFREHIFRWQTVAEYSVYMLIRGDSMESIMQAIETPKREGCAGYILQIGHYTGETQYLILQQAMLKIGKGIPVYVNLHPEWTLDEAIHWSRQFALIGVRGVFDSTLPAVGSVQSNFARHAPFPTSSSAIDSLDGLVWASQQRAIGHAILQPDLLDSLESAWAFQAIARSQRMQVIGLPAPGSFARLGMLASIFSANPDLIWVHRGDESLPVGITKAAARSNVAHFGSPQVSATASKSMTMSCVPLALIFSQLVARKHGCAGLMLV